MTHIVSEIKTSEPLALILISRLLLSTLKIRNYSYQVLTNALIDVFSLAHYFIWKVSTVGATRTKIFSVRQKIPSFLTSRNGSRGMEKLKIYHRLYLLLPSICFVMRRQCEQ